MSWGQFATPILRPLWIPSNAWDSLAMGAHGGQRMRYFNTRQYGVSKPYSCARLGNMAHATYYCVIFASRSLLQGGQRNILS